jgi:hypothetical protein
MKFKDLNTENTEKKLYDKLMHMLSQKTYEDSVEYIDDIVKDPKLKFILSLGFGGKYADYKLKLSKKNIEVYKLIPTQNEIGFDETLKFLCSGKNLEKCFDTPAVIKTPIVTFRGTFIIDGHHRWSEIYATNPKAKVKCIDIDGNLSPIQMLKCVQATIGSNLGYLNHKESQGKNLLKASEKEIRNYVISNIEKDKFLKYYKDPVNDIVKNCEMLKHNNCPILGSPSRGYMPQTSKDPDLIDDLKRGITKI